MLYAGTGRRIKELRTKHRMTQIDLAKKLGISKSVISSYMAVIPLKNKGIAIIV